MTLTREAIESKVAEILTEQLGCDIGEVVPEAKLVEDLGADSLDMVELVISFEEAFELEIPDEDAEKILTVSGAVDYIERRTTLTP